MTRASFLAMSESECDGGGGEKVEKEGERGGRPVSHAEVVLGRGRNINSMMKFVTIFSNTEGTPPLLLPLPFIDSLTIMARSHFDKTERGRQRHISCPQSSLGCRR